MSRVYKEKYKIYRNYDVDLFNILWTKSYFKDEVDYNHRFYSKYCNNSKGIIEKYIRPTTLLSNNSESFGVKSIRVIKLLHLAMESKKYNTQYNTLSIMENDSLKKKKKRKKTNFGEYLYNKQLLKMNYINLNEKHFKKILLKSFRYNSSLINNFSFFLERRLDAVLLRSNLFSSKSQVRQLLSYNNVLVNFNLINSPHYLLNIGDVISLKKKYNLIALKNLEKRLVLQQVIGYLPYYLEIDYRLVFISLVQRVKFSQLPYFSKLRMELII